MAWARAWRVVGAFLAGVGCWHRRAGMGWCVQCEGDVQELGATGIAAGVRWQAMAGLGMCGRGAMRWCAWLGLHGTG